MALVFNFLPGLTCLRFSSNTGGPSGGSGLRLTGPHLGRWAVPPTGRWDTCGNLKSGLSVLLFWAEEPAQARQCWQLPGHCKLKVTELSCSVPEAVERGQCHRDEAQHRAAAGNWPCCWSTVRLWLGGALRPAPEEACLGPGWLRPDSFSVCPILQHKLRRCQAHGTGWRPKGPWQLSVLQGDRRSTDRGGSEDLRATLGPSGAAE